MDNTSFGELYRSGTTSMLNQPRFSVTGGQKLEMV